MHVLRARGFAGCDEVSTTPRLATLATPPRETSRVVVQRCHDASCGVHVSRPREKTSPPYILFCLSVCLSVCLSYLDVGELLARALVHTGAKANVAEGLFSLLPLGPEAIRIELLLVVVLMVVVAVATWQNERVEVL